MAVERKLFKDLKPYFKNKTDKQMKLSKQRNIKGKEDTLNRLRDLEVDSFDRDSNLSAVSSTMSRKLGIPNTGMEDSLFARKTNQNPFIADTVSEINDNKEKNAIFNHSMKHGLFNDIRASPLRDRLPLDLQVYDPALERRLFAKEASRIPGEGPSSRRTPASNNRRQPNVDDFGSRN